MAKRSTKAATEVKDDFAEELISKISEQVTTLISRNYPQIKKIIDDEDEIKLSFGVSVIDRKASPGEQADKDNRIRTSVSFAVKFSDNIESELPDPAQGQLGMEPEVVE